jgi:hypothetical protein
VVDAPSPRYRCTGCGNLTRFDVTSTRRTRAFHHYTVGGELQVEDTETLSETIEDVRCRWCGTGATVVPFTDDSATDALVDEAG